MAQVNRSRGAMTLIREIRTVTLDEIRVKTDVENSEIRVGGHAAVWDKPAWIGPAKFGFSERFSKGAFSKTINDGADIRYLFNHNPDHVLARTKSGTLQLAENNTGLNVDAVFAPTTVGRDLAILMERGDVNQMSVGMQVINDKWEEIRGNDGNVYEQRTITEAKLFDVSAVTYPAYEETDAGIRTVEAARESRDARGQFVKRIEEGMMTVNEAREKERLEPLSTDDTQYSANVSNEEPVTATPNETTDLSANVENADVVVIDDSEEQRSDDERQMPLTTMLLRHMDGDHLHVPRALCPACAKAEPLTSTPPPEGTSENS